ncbi:MAG: KH domain-containing protein [Bacilli bacterium]|nr:KH domain-containing protein [Bacilli bacterium]
MNLVELTEFLVKNLVSNQDAVEVNVAEENDIKIVQVLVAEEDIAAVIGKRGNIANAIRTIIQASSYHNNDGKVRINFDAK